MGIKLERRSSPVQWNAPGLNDDLQEAGCLNLRKGANNAEEVGATVTTMSLGLGACVRTGAGGGSSTTATGWAGGGGGTGSVGWIAYDWY